MLAGIVIIAINPAKQFAQARNTERESNVSAILNAIGQRIADNKGTFSGTYTIGSTTHTCPSLPSAAADIKSGALNSDLADCLVPTYISTQIPVDPAAPASDAWSDGPPPTYDTHYTVYQDTATGRIKVCAPNEATETSIPNAAEFCLTR